MRKNKQLKKKGKKGLSHFFQGIIAIAKDGVPQKWPLVRTARIPNFFLFVVLIHQLVNGRVSYQPLEFEFKDYFLELMRLLFSPKSTIKKWHVLCVSIKALTRPGLFLHLP